MAVKTSKDIELFSQMYTDANIPVDAIARRFKMAPGSVYRIGFELRLKRPRGPAGVQLNLMQIRTYIEAMSAELPHLVYLPRTHFETPKHSLELILILGDVHSGRVTRSTNTQVLANRIEALGERVVEHARRLGLLGCKLSIFSVGDLVTGERVGGQVSLEELEHTVLTQCYSIAIPYLSRMTIYLANNFNTIDIFGVSGNHGPVSKPALSSGANWDNVVGLGWQATMINYKQVTFDIATEDFYNFATVGGMDWLIVHGDQMRGSNPYGSIVSTMLNWHRAMPEHFDAMAMGHFHNINKVREAYMTGCMVTDDEWSREVVKREGDCAQLLLMVGGGKVRAEIPIWLDDITEEREDLYR